jgi:hypothetical protein
MAFWKRVRPSPTYAEGLASAPAEAAAWLRGRMLDPDLTRGVRVGDVLPTAFGAYVRIMHPVPTPGGPTTWADIAERTGRVAHSRMQWQAIAYPAPGHDAPMVSGDGPAQGVLASELASALIDILSIHTGTPESCFLAIWHDAPGLPATSGTDVEHGGRTYHLFTTDLSTLARPLVVDPDGDPVQPPVSAHLWWPDDHAWFVATEVDFRSTLVGTSRVCADQILDDPTFETYEVAIDDRADLGGDDQNPLPPPLAHLFS